MYPVKITNFLQFDDADEYFIEAIKNTKSILGATVTHDLNENQFCYLLTIYFENQAEAIMFELKHL